MYTNYEDDITPLLDKWAKHYGYASITARELGNNFAEKWLIKLDYLYGRTQYFRAYTIDDIKRKIVANKPKLVK